MSKLPLRDSIPRFIENEDRVSKFVNGAADETWQTEDGTVLPTINGVIEGLGKGFDSRAAAEAARPLPWVNEISYIGPFGALLQFVEDTSAVRPALTTADGRKWMPNVVATPEHYGATGGADDTAAVVAAWTSGLPVVIDHTYRVSGNLTLPTSAPVSGYGKITALTSGTRPTKSTLIGAASNAARTALLDAYYTARITLTGSTWRVRGVTFENVVFKSTSEPTILGHAEFLNCASDNVEFKAGAGSFLNAPAFIVTNCGGSALTALRGGAIMATGAIITNGQRGLHCLYGGIIDAENAVISTMSNFSTFILYSGSINLKNGRIEHSIGGLINNYGGTFNAEGITITDIPNGLAAMIESNGAAYMQNCIIERCQNGLGVALGGFIQARNAKISDISVVIANALNDGMISLEGLTVSGTNPNPILFQARGAGRLQMAAPGSSGLTSVAATALTPRHGTVGNGNAYIGLMTATGPAASGIKPGPYADDAAAATGGVPVGGDYRKADGTMAWRQA